MDSRKTRLDLALATLAHLLQKAAGYGVLLLLTRHLPKDEVGAFFFASAVGTFFALITELGTSRFVVREAAAAATPGAAADMLGRVLAVRLVLTALAAMGVAGFAAFVKPELWDILLLSAAYVFAEDLFYSPGGVLVGIRQVKDWVTVMVINRLLLLSLVALAVSQGSGLRTIIVCHLVASLGLLAAGMFRARRHVGAIRLRLRDPVTWTIVRECVPFFVLTVLSLLHFKVDTLMLGTMLPAERALLAVATYEAAFKLLEVSRFLVRPIAMVYYPLCTQLAVKGDWAHFLPLYRKLTLITGVGALLVAVVVIAGAEPILSIMFGEQYRDSAGTLRVLFLGAPLLFVEYISMFFAQSLRLERRAIVVTAVALGANVAINAVAIPSYGPVGAAWATVTTQAVLTVGLVAMVLRRARALSSDRAAEVGGPTAAVPMQGGA